MMRDIEPADRKAFFVGMVELKPSAIIENRSEQDGAGGESCEQGGKCDKSKSVVSGHGVVAPD
jgi:hypothetical protein